MNIDQKLRNKLHGPMHYKQGVACVFNGHMKYKHVLDVMKRHSNSPISKFNRTCNELRVSGQCSHTIQVMYVLTVDLVVNLLIIHVVHSYSPIWKFYLTIQLKGHGNTYRLNFLSKGQSDTCIFNSNENG